MRSVPETGKTLLKIMTMPVAEKYHPHPKDLRKLGNPGVDCACEKIHGSQISNSSQLITTAPPPIDDHYLAGFDVFDQTCAVG